MASNLLDLHQEGSSANAVARPRLKWWSRVFIPALVLLGVGALLVGAAWQHLLPTPVVQVEAAIAKRVGDSHPASMVVQAAGWLEAFPYQHHVTALTNGVAREILVLEGDAVEKGAVVARLDARDAELGVQTAAAELALRQAERDEAAARLAAARQTWDHPVALERQIAMAGASVREATADIAEIQARIAEKTSILDQARKDASRAERLFEAKVLSNRDAEHASTDAEAAQSAFDALERSLTAATERRQRAEADLHAANRELELRIADRRERDEATALLSRSEAAVKLAEVALAKAELRLERMTITASVPGIVVTRHKEPGDKVMLDTDSPRSATIVSLYNPDDLQARVDVPLADAGQITVGQLCEITTDVLPNRTFKGRVTRVLHRADIQKNTLQAKVAIEAPTAELRPEMLCRVRFLARRETPDPDDATVTRIFAPRRAIVDGKLWIVHDSDGTFARVESHAAPAATEMDEWMAVDGLHQGALVVVNPTAELKSGQRVRLATPEVAP